MFWIIEGILFALACVVDGVIGIYPDSIAGSFDRSPQAVVTRRLILGVSKGGGNVLGKGGEIVLSDQGESQNISCRLYRYRPISQVNNTPNQGYFINLFSVRNLWSV